MTIELLDEGATDAEEFVIAWLQPLARSASMRRVDDPLPFRLVNQVMGADDPYCGKDTAVVSVHTLCDATIDNAEDLAAQEADKTHRRMLYLARYPDTDVVLSDGRLANLDYMDVVQKPIWVYYDNIQILRKVGRYRIGLSYVAL